MTLFKSSREKRLWLWALAVLVTIFSTLFVGQPLIKLFSDQNVRAVIFLLVMILIGAAVIVHALKTKPGKIELVLLLGIVAVYTMFFLRLGMLERSHLIEYSVLAIFIHMALIERANQEHKILKPALLAFVITLIIGILDECIQIFLPGRVFDPIDIQFNGLAALMAIGSRVTLQWVRKKLNKN